MHPSHQPLSQQSGDNQVAALDHTPEHASENADGHASHGKHHGGGHGDGHGGDGHGGGGHGGNWLVTYCDMITLLIAFFICILTFASKESGKEKYPKLRDSVLYGPGGSGPAGPTHKGSDADSIIWRQVLLSAHHGPDGSRIPPLYSDPQAEKTAQVLASLTDSNLPSLGNILYLRFPLAVLFDTDDRLTPTGARLLLQLARNIHSFPLDIYIQAPDQERLKLAVRVNRFLVEQAGLEAGRLGVGIQADSGAGIPSLAVSLLPRKGGI